VQFYVDVISDHLVANNSYSNEMCFLWHEVDYDGMNLYLSAVDWYSILSINLSPNDLWSALRSNIQGGPRKVKPTTILLVTFECVGKIQWFLADVNCI